VSEQCTGSNRHVSRPDRSVVPGSSRCHAEAGMAGHPVSGQWQSKEQMAYWHSDSYTTG